MAGSIREQQANAERRYDKSVQTVRLNGKVLDDVKRAADLLRGGGTVAFPTETVYGLGAHALDAAAVARIFEAKKRPAWDPLIVHFGEAAGIDAVAEVSEAARLLGQAFWPGPLTLLLPKRVSVPEVVTAGRQLVGVRVPAHPIALQLLRFAGIPVAAPSANVFGHTSPTTAAHVIADLDGRIDAVLDGGATNVGVESTVLDPAAMMIYRPGAITPERIEHVSGVRPTLYQPPLQRLHAEALPSPGVGIRHYAPRARVVLVEGNQPALRAAVHPGDGVMLPQEWSLADSTGIEQYPWGRWAEPETLAARLFAGLRQLDAVGVQRIVCPLPKDEGIGHAIRDRLLKAAKEK